MLIPFEYDLLKNSIAFILYLHDDNVIKKRLRCKIQRSKIFDI